MSALFDHFSACLQENGFAVSAGKILDASFVEVPRQQNSREENQQIKSGQIPKAGRAMLLVCVKKIWMRVGQPKADIVTSVTKITSRSIDKVN